ncbi:hypothetical protein HNY73_006144 [Argiope bruennichi]|uniref:Uncharacterized protein n=1 Tax=Argiope bruennichi TaxID=94029 RepID=A0A8T0FP59_ARGBR|nr:hypothetical protein HNY73_006144 [Argiope bruennichi]
MLRFPKFQRRIEELLQTFKECFTKKWVVYLTWSTGQSRLWTLVLSKDAVVETDFHIEILFCTEISFKGQT